MPTEAHARIKINKLLEKAGWRFFDSEDGSANILLEGYTRISTQDIDAFGEDYEHIKSGYLDFLLLDEYGFPFVVLEAKREDKSPLDGKEQARAYANSKNVRFVLLSNGNIHYFWDLESGNPEVITEFPTPSSINHRQAFKPNPQRLVQELVDDDYIAVTQNPGYQRDPRWLDESQRFAFIDDTGLRLLRKYQLNAIHALQKSAAEGNTRYLFEMATGTGKTLVAAAIIKLFLRTGNARRVLFLVDRLELEDQAYKNFVRYLSNDYQTVIYKENRENWHGAEILVATVQSLSFDNKFLRLFSPTDFDLVISDEAHRSISGNSRAVFEYFVGYKLGLTATPKDYLKHIDPDKLSQADPRAWERRQLLDTYVTFGCASGEPTFRYSLIEGAAEGFLVNPIVADARTEITTQLLSDQGYAVMVETEEGDDEEQTFFQRDFERKFFSEKTNLAFCSAFFEHALRDPITGEVGKSIVFCVSQAHAAKITQLLNQLAHQIFPNRYKSDFAVQITSNVSGAQQYTRNFSNNNLFGHSPFLSGYKTSKARVCVTVGMMTTGYDCQDILNLAMMRPIFSPTDFIQIKGRGTRTFTFKHSMKQDGQIDEVAYPKERYKLFDYFANCEYFEEKYDYDEILDLPRKTGLSIGEGEPTPATAYTTVFRPDPLTDYEEIPIGIEGMRVDRKLFEKIADPVQSDPDIVQAVDNEQWERAVHLLRERYENKPEEFFTLDKLRRSENIDRRLTWKEVIQRIFGHIDRFKTRDDLLEEEYQKFVSIHRPDSSYAQGIRTYLKAYLTDPEIREIIETRQYAQLANNPKFTLSEFRALDDWRNQVPDYVKDYVSLNTFV